MQFVHIDPARIEREWPVIAEILAPAVEWDRAGMSMDDLKTQLMGGKFHLVEGRDERANGLLAFHMFDRDGEVCCFASFLAGVVNGGPKQMIRTMRALMKAFEDQNREAGVKRMFIGGRDWGRVFPDYELTGDVPNRRQKRL